MAQEIDELYWTLNARREQLVQAIGEAQRELKAAGEQSGQTFGRGIAAGIASVAQQAQTQAAAAGTAAGAGLTRSFEQELAALPRFAQGQVAALVAGLRASGVQAGEAMVTGLAAGLGQLVKLEVLTPDQAAQILQAFRATGEAAGEALSASAAGAAARAGQVLAQQVQAGAQAAGQVAAAGGQQAGTGFAEGFGAGAQGTAEAARSATAAAGAAAQGQTGPAGRQAGQELATGFREGAQQVPAAAREAAQGASAALQTGAAGAGTEAGAAAATGFQAGAAKIPEAATQAAAATTQVLATGGADAGRAGGVALTDAFRAELAGLPGPARTAVEQIVSLTQGQGAAAGDEFVREFGAKLKTIESFGIITPEQRARLVAAAKAAGQQAGQELGAGAKQAAGKSGQEAADEIIQRLRTEFRAKIGAAQEDLARNLINPRVLQQRTAEATQALRGGLLEGMAELRKQGPLSGEVMAKFGDALAQTAPKAGLLERAIGFVTQRMKFFIATTVALAGIRIARFLAGTVADFAELDAALTRSLAIMGDVGAAMERALGAETRKLSRDFNLDAAKLGDTLFFLASAGKSADQSLADLPVVTKFAKAGVFDLEKAASLLVDTQAALGLASKDAARDMEGLTRVADVLVKANTLSNATTEQFAEALTNKAAGALRLVNKDIEEGTAVLAAYAQQGLKGAVAGNTLAVVLRDLQRAALKHGDEFKKAGVAVFDEAGKMRNLADIIGDLEKRLTGMSDAQKRATVIQLGFQDRSVSALLTLLGFSKAIRDTEVQLRQAAGTMESISARQMKAFSERAGQLGKDWTELKRRIGDALLPVAEWAVQAGRGLLSGLDDPLDTLIDKFEKLGGAAETVLAIQMGQRIKDTKQQIADLQGQIQNATLTVGVKAVPTNPFAGGGRATEAAEKVPIPNLSIDALERLQAQAQINLARATAEFNQNASDENRRAVETFQAQVAEIADVIKAKQALAAANDKLLASESALDEQIHRADIEGQIRVVNAQIQNLLASGTESAAIAAEITKLEEKRKQLQAQLHPPQPKPPVPPGEEGGIPDLEGERRKAEIEAASRRLAEQLNEFKQLQRAGFQSLGEVPDQLRTQLERILAIDKEIAQVRKDRATLAGRLSAQEIAASDALLASLEREKAGLVQGSQQIIDLLNKIPAVAGKMVNSFAQAGSQVPEHFAKITAAVTAAQIATEAVTRAELELRAARLANDPERVAAAERKVAAARGLARAEIAALTKELEGAGLKQEELNKVLAIFVRLLKEAGINIDTTATKLTGLAGKGRLLEGLARALLSVADAAHAIPEGLRQTLQGVVDLVAGIVSLKEANERAKQAEEDLAKATEANDREAIAKAIADQSSALLAQIGSAATIIGGVIGTAAGIGRSLDAAFERHRLELVKHIDAMAQLREALDRLRTAVLANITAPQKADVTGRAEAVLAGRGIGTSLSDLTKIQLGRGVVSISNKMTPEDLAALRQLAQQTGIQFLDEAGGKIDLELLKAAIEAFKQLDLGSFGKDLQGRLDALNFTFQLLGDAAGDARSKLNQFISVIKQFSPGFASQLEQILQEQGPDAALAFVQGLIKQFGESGLTPELQAIFGSDLTADDIKKILEESNGFLKDLAQNGGAGGGQTTAFQISRTITERQADLLITVLTSMVILQERDTIAGERAARFLEEIIRILGGNVPELPPPPSPVFTLPEQPGQAAGGIDVLVTPMTRTADAAEAILALLEQVQFEPLQPPTQQELNTALPPGGSQPVPLQVTFGDINVDTTIVSPTPVTEDTGRAVGRANATEVSTQMAKNWKTISRFQGRGDL